MATDNPVMLVFFLRLVIFVFLTVPAISIALMKFLGERAVPLSGELSGLKSFYSKSSESRISVSTCNFLPPDAITALAMPGPSLAWLKGETLEMALTSEGLFGKPEVRMV